MTPRSLWNGTIAFGEVAIPVKLFAATEDHRIHFREVRVSDGCRVEHRLVGADSGREIRRDRIAKAYETRGGTLSTLLFANEIRDPGEIPAVPSGRRAAPRRAEVERALKVIDAMTRDFDPARYEDCHRSRLMKVIQRKRRSGEVEIPEIEPEPDPVPDLMEALEASLSRSGRKKAAR